MLKRTKKIKDIFALKDEKAAGTTPTAFLLYRILLIIPISSFFIFRKFQ